MYGPISVSVSVSADNSHIGHYRLSADMAIIGELMPIIVFLVSNGDFHFFWRETKSQNLTIFMNLLKIEAFC